MKKHPYKNPIDSKRHKASMGGWYITWKIVAFIFKLLFKLVHLLFRIALGLLIFCLDVATSRGHDNGLSITDYAKINRLHKDIKKVNKKLSAR